VRGFLLARARQAALVLVAVVTLTFVLAHAAPGDPFWAIEDPQLSAAERDRLRTEWGYDLPVWKQYVTWLGNIATGDFGWSHSRGQPVAAVLRDAVPNTLLLMLPAVLLGMLAGIALGTWQAARHGRAASRAVDAATLTLASIPDFVVALVVLSLFALRWHLAPASGMVDPVFHDSMPALGRMLDVASHLWLPGCTLALLIAAAVSRYQRVAVLGVLHEPYIQTARAKGASDRVTILRHAVPNALGPVIAIGGLLFPTMFAGAVFVEKIFAWPGMGRTIVDAVAGRDYALVQAIVVAGTVLVLVANTAADIIASVVNPRTRLEA
jgi:peptide/nickel transport system permease protein